jgi:hypothetical protein
LVNEEEKNGQGTGGKGEKSINNKKCMGFEYLLVREIQNFLSYLPCPIPYLFCS